MPNKYPSFEEYFEAVSSKVAEEVFRRIVDRTPVDTGLARDSWQLSKRPGEWLVSNPQPYVERLENGWSRQAPSGMVRLTLMELDDIAEQIKRQESQ